MVRLSCPSCNSSFALAELPAERRASCPRCGDVFPIRSWEEVVGSETTTRLSAVSSTARRDRARWSVQRTVAVALAMGLVGLLAGLGMYFVRENRRQQSHAEQAASFEATPPSQLVGLGYLPTDASIVFVVQPAPALGYATRSHQEPSDFLTRAGLPRQVLDVLAGTGLPLEQIDHIAGAVNVDGLRLSLVLVTRRPLDEAQFLKRLRATRSNGATERYSVDIGGLPLALARVSDSVWLFGFDAEKDLAGADRGGQGPGGRQFAPGLSEMIGSVPPDAAAWLVTDEDRWAEKPLVKLVFSELLKKPEWLPSLAKGRALVAALSLNEPPRLRIFVKAADASTAERIRSYFQARAASAENATSGGAGEIAFFDSPIDPANAFNSLREMLNEAVKP
jgi:hypothetical protein